MSKSSGMHGQRSFGSGETETDEFGVKEPHERKENPSQDSSALNSPGNQELDQSYVSASVRKPVQNTFSTAATG